MNGDLRRSARKVKVELIELERRVGSSFCSSARSSSRSSSLDNGAEVEAPDAARAAVTDAFPLVAVYAVYAISLPDTRGPTAH